VASATGEIIRIKLGDDLAAVVLPALQSLLNTVQGIIKAFDRLEPATKKVIIQVLGLIAALGPLALFGSLLKYAYGGFLNSFVKGFIFARNVVGALNGDLVRMGKLMKNTPKMAGRAKAFNIWRLGGGGANLGKALVSAPVVLLSTAVVVGTVAFFRYAKRIREAAEAARSFNSMQVTVNDTVKAFNEMDKSDIEQMTLDEMMLAKAKAAQVWADSYKMYKQYEKNIAEGAGSKSLNKKYMQEEADAVAFAKKQYDNLTASIYEMQKRLVADRARAQRVDELKKTKAENEAITKVMQDMYDALAQVNQQAKYMKDIKKPFDAAEESAQILLKTLDDLTGGDIKLHYEDANVQKVIGMLKNLGIDFTKADEIAEDFAATLASIDMKKMLLGDEFDADTEKLKVYEKQLEKFLEEILDKTKRPDGPSIFDKQQVDEYVKGINTAKQAIEDFTDAQNIKFLHAMAQAFGDIDSQIEVVNGALQSAERKLRNMGMKDGVNEDFLKQAEYVKALRIQLDDLTSSKDIVFFADMAQALQDGNYYLDFLNANISKLKTELERLSASRLGDQENFIKKAKELEGMQHSADAIKILQDGISEFFQASQEDMQNFGDFFESWARSIVQAFQKMVADIIAKKIIFAIISKATAGVGGKAAGALRNTSIQGLATGGVIPAGFPNDSYPAALTSGEGVLPVHIMKKLSRSSEFEGGEVRFEIEGDRLVGILKKKMKQNSLY
jgi:hypothetical protein